MVEPAESFKETFSSYKNRDNGFDKFLEKLESASADLESSIVADLRQAKSCLSLGPGTGKFELEFIEHLMPALRSFTAIEPDGSSATELRLNLQRRLPDVIGVFHETTAERCKDVIAGNEFDVILLFSVLVLTDLNYRATLCRDVLPRWSAPGGIVVFGQFNRADHPRSFHRILEQLNPDYRVPTYEYFEELITGNGYASDETRFRRETTLDIQYSQNLSDPDEAVFQMFRMLVRKDIDVDEARRVIDHVWPGGKTDERFQRFGFYRKLPI